MVLAAGLGIGLGELDGVGTLQMIHGSDVLAVGTQNFHVFLDVAWFEHATPPFRTYVNGYGGPQFPDSMWQ
jgi:hypothetical protein